MKLSDFRYTQTIPTTILGDVPVAEKGYPDYMAPELFLLSGTHSYQSDLWALGCTLYEMRRGDRPFGHFIIDKDEDGLEENKTTFNSNKNTSARKNRKMHESLGCLEHDIKHIDPMRQYENESLSLSDIPSMSAELADLVSGLLEKYPSNRWVLF